MEILANSFQNEIFCELKNKAFVALQIWKKNKCFQRSLRTKNKLKMKKKIIAIWKKKSLFSTYLKRFFLINETFRKKFAFCNLKKIAFLKKQMLLLENLKSHRIFSKCFGLLKYYRDIQRKKQTSNLKLSGS